MGTLILQTDMSCRITVDDKYVDELGEGQSKKLRVTPGQHTVGAVSLNGLYRWAEPIQVEEFKSLKVSVELKKKKAEAEEAARIEEAKRAEAKEAATLKERARLEEERRKADAEAKYKEETANIGKGFVIVPAGEFLMGDRNGNRDERPAHRVRISRQFEMGKYEVTEAQWSAVMGTAISGDWGSNPVANVSWENVQKFLQLLNSRKDGHTYRLPTEAEWEYACRAGSTGDYAGDLNLIAWYLGNSDLRKHLVGQKPPNAWGLYDMHGNVREWCQDSYDEQYYARGHSVDPQGPISGSYRVIRGGSWGGDGLLCRSAARDWDAPTNRGNNLGFRLVRTLR